MTTKIANVANLAFHAFQQHSVRSALASAATSFSNNSNELFYVNSSHSNLHQVDSNYTSSSTQNKLSSDSLQRLLMSLSSLTPKDVGFDLRWISDSNVYAAPVAYVHIMENEVFSMGIFILRPGSRIPLHDHPGMYGLLRVLYGSLRCRSFTQLKNIKSSDLSNCGSSLSMFSGSKWQLTDLLVTRPHQDLLLTPDHSPHMLSPLEGNLHEITSVDGPAVFLDILAPPYDHDLGTRECRFYKEVILPQTFSGAQSNHQISTGSLVDENPLEVSDSNQDSDMVASQLDDANKSAVVYMIETNQPMDYWCESAEYAGPSIV